MRKRAIYSIFAVVLVAGVLASSPMSLVISRDGRSLIDAREHDTRFFPKQEGGTGTSTGVLFVQLPTLSQKYISPDTTPGEGDSTVLSFSVDHDVNYTVQIDAYYTPVSTPGIYNVEDGSAYMMDNGTWLIALSKAIDDGGPRNLSLGIGDPANLEWQDVGLINFTDSIALAAIGSKIRIAFAERKAIDIDHPSYIRYFASDDFGHTWNTGLIVNLESSPGQKISGLSMDATGDNFTLVWNYSNTTEISNVWKEMSTIWEASHTGAASSGWTLPKNLTCLANGGIKAYSPRITIDHATGRKYLAANVWSNPEFIATLYDLGDDVEATAWVDTWTLSGLENNDEPIVDVAFDQADGSFHFLNNSDSSITAWRRAASWKAPISTPDVFIAHSRDKGFKMFGNDGPKFFSTGVAVIGGSYAPGILDCEPGFSFKDISGTLNAYSVFSSTFDGKDYLGRSHGARAYVMMIDVYNDIYGGLDSYQILGVDDSTAELTVELATSMISPFASPGYQDAARFDITASKTGIATLFIESPSHVVDAVLNMTDGLSTYGLPAMCGDGRNMYLFHERAEGAAEHYVVMYKSQDGGLSWTNPKTIMGTVERFSYIEAECKGSQIHCYVQDEMRSYWFFSSDGGETFIKTEIDLPIDAICADDHVSVWRGASNQTHFTINRSTDHGFNWEPFLSLPQSGFLALYNYLDGVAWDPVSKNYSFILTNGTMEAGTQNVTFITTTSTGATYTHWENICAGGHPAFPSHTRKIEVDVRYTGTNATEWIITCSNYNSIDLTTYSAPLAFCTTSGDGTFSPWGNFTGITGGTMNSLVVWWDIAFPVDGYPCFVNPFLDFSLSIPQVKQITVYAASTLVYSRTMNLQANITGQIKYVGITANGDVVTDGEYIWRVVFKDVVGHQVASSGTLVVDNIAPTIKQSPNYTNRTRPAPYIPVSIRIQASDLHLDNAYLLYRNSTLNTWSNVTMDALALNGTTTNYTATIPADEATDRFWIVVVIDNAGNRHVLDDSGQPFNYRIPNIRIEEHYEPPTVLDFGRLGFFTVTFIIPQDADYVSTVLITYEFDDGSGIHVDQMSNLTNSLYYYTFTSIPANATSLTYSVTAIDYYGTETPSDRTRQVAIIPPLPAWSIAQDQLAPVVAISLIVGVFAGALYSAIIKRRTPLARAVAEVERRTGRSSSGKHVSISLGITAAAIGATVALGLVSVYVYDFPEGAMLSFMGTFLASVVLWMLFAAWGINRSFERKMDKLSGTFMLYVIGFSIFATLLAVTLIGNEVAWWRIRVNEQAYNVAGIPIPRMMATLVSTFFSSIILLNISISKGVKRVRKELDEAELQNMNPGWLLKKRDGEIASLMGSIGFKGLIFVTIIGVTIIFASDLSTYAPQGAIIILPFGIGVILSLAIGALLQRRIFRSKDEVVFDRLTACPECHGATALGSSFCEACGKALVSSMRSRPACTCKKCQGLIPENTKRCRFCGEQLD